MQVSRLGNPLVNEVVLPLALKDAFNGLEPTGDAAALSFVTNPLLPPLMQALFGVQTPPTPRNDLVTIFLTGIPGLNQVGTSPRASEMLRLNTAIPPSSRPHRLGVLAGDLAGFPNGRRVGDDVVDIALQAMAGATPLTPQSCGRRTTSSATAWIRTTRNTCLDSPSSLCRTPGANRAPNRGCAAPRSRAADEEDLIVVLSAVAIGAIAAAATGTTNHRGAEAQRFLGFSVSRVHLPQNRRSLRKFAAVPGFSG